MRSGCVMSMLVAALVAGCYSPKLTNFGFTCDATAPKPCPDGYVCRSGFCTDGSGGTPPGASGGNGGDDMATSQGGGGGGGSGGGGGGAQDLAMPLHDLAMTPADLAKPPPPDLVVVSSCAHDECTTGTRLVKSCSQCATDVCNNDPTCCSTSGQWDSICVGEVNQYCTTKTCP